MDSTTPIVSLKGITFAYPGRPDVLNGVNLDFYPDQRIGLLGPNGSGKTTLFHVIMGLLKPTAGTIEIFGKPVVADRDFAEIYRRIGLLFQDPDDQLFCPTVLEDVAFGPLNLGKSRDEAIAIARRTLDELGLAGFENRITHHLSGGEKRFVSLATVLSMGPKVLLLDEPTTGLDNQTRSRLITVLKELSLSCVLITHDMEFLAQITDDIFLMENGRLLTEQRVSLHQHVHAHPHGSHPHEHHR